MHRGSRAALAGIETAVWRTPSGGGLGLLLEEVDALGAACEAAKAVVVAEAIERETTDGAAALTLTQWVLEHAPSTRAGGARPVVEVAQAFAKPANAPVRDAVLAGVLPVRSAASVVSEADRSVHSGQRPDHRQDAAVVNWDVLRLFAVFGWVERDGTFLDRRVRVTEAGRTALLEGLRRRSTAPRARP
ncbi:hypothetical protein [Knoellia koreensis]|uniref:DUF222 domain-containing protein n=1 Tax=Knoellia koreensis TaxID=2730921 RepID=A0A849HD94_9MICO|nr:hypothetical protein [Knoellia sp. DB2414S]NNM45388.1 hypothetical protein [Knoellia sp. DB2414S]